MDKDKMPKDLDVFLSLLGEIDIIKNQVGMLDKSTHITLAQDNVSAILGNSECFRILKLVEMLNANISAINGAFLGAAESVTAQYVSDPVEKTDDTPQEEQPPEEAIAQEPEGKQKEEGKEGKDNQIINNMLQYFKERFEGNGRE